MEMLGLDSVQVVLLIGLVSGATELVKRVFDKDWRAAAIIAVAAFIGGISAPFIGSDVIMGIVGGLATSGYVSIAQNFGKTSRKGEVGPAGPQGPVGPKGDKGDTGDKE